MLECFTVFVVGVLVDFASVFGVFVFALWGSIELMYESYLWCGLGRYVAEFCDLCFDVWALGIWV